MDEKIICEFCGQEIPQDTEVIILDGCPCCEDCALRIDLQKKLDNDPVLSLLNDKYIKFGVVKYISGIILVAALFLMYTVLENSLPDALGIIAMLTVPVALIVFIVSAVFRAVYHRKINAEISKNN